MSKNITASAFFSEKIQQESDPIAITKLLQNYSIAMGSNHHISYSCIEEIRGWITQTDTSCWLGSSKMSAFKVLSEEIKKEGRKTPPFSKEIYVALNQDTIFNTLEALQNYLEGKLAGAKLTVTFEKEKTLFHLIKAAGKSQYLGSNLPEIAYKIARLDTPPKSLDFVGSHQDTWKILGSRIKATKKPIYLRWRIKRIKNQGSYWRWELWKKQAPIGNLKRLRPYSDKYIINLGETHEEAVLALKKWITENP